MEKEIKHLFSFKDDITDETLIAEVGVRLNQDWWIMTGYKKSANILYENLKNNYEQNEALLDQLVYPIYFNYRTALEIYYKKLIQLYSSDDIKLDHNILNLHRTLSDKLPKGYSINSNLTFIEYVNQIDPKFEKFRYDFTRDGEYGFDERDTVDIESMFCGFNTTYNVLDLIWEDLCIKVGVPKKHYEKPVLIKKKKQL